jgi:hypothetical protein
LKYVIEIPAADVTKQNKKKKRRYIFNENKKEIKYFNMNTNFYKVSYVGQNFYL